MKLKDYISGIVSEKFQTDEEVLNGCLDFIFDLDDEQLTDEQVDKLHEILDSIEDDESDVDEVMLAGRTSQQKKSMSRKYYRQHKNKILTKRKKYRKSASGKKDTKMRNKMSKVGKTLTGKRKVKYH